MKSNVESRVDAFRIELEKFSARWNHVKPSAETIEGGTKEACTTALLTVKDKKAEFEEVAKTMESLL